MTLTKKYQTRPTSIASYDYTDIAEGTGVNDFYGFVNVTGSGTSSGSTLISGSSLSQNALYSAQIEDVTAYSTSTWASSGFWIAGYHDDEIDVDFDLTPFYLPKNIGGTAYVRFSYYANAVTNNLYIGWKAKLRKWDGTTETEIAEAVSAVNIISSGTNEKVTLVMPITVPFTHFNKGDQLRLTICGYTATSGNPGSTTGNIAFGTDPQNQDGTYLIPSTGTETTTLRIWIPFKLEEI